MTPPYNRRRQLRNILLQEASMAKRRYSLPVYLVAGNSIERVSGSRCELVEMVRKVERSVARLLSWVAYS